LPFKVGKGLDELSRVLVRNNIGSAPRAQEADETSKKAFDRAHGEKREMCDIMHDAVRCMNNSVPQERAKINVREDESDVCDIIIKARAGASEKADAAIRFIRRQREETDKEYERNENEDKRGHGN